MRNGETIKISQEFNKVAHLFGFKADPEPQVELPEILQPEGTVMAVHPMLLKEDFNKTMDDFRVFAANYNIRVRQENEQIALHNSHVQLRLEQTPLTPGELQFVALFHKNYNALWDREYNSKVDEFCADRGYLITKRRIQTLKYQTELVFQNFLHLYSVQLNTRTTNYIRYRVTSPRPLQELEIRSDKVTHLERNGVQSLPVCNRTVRNHRRRLQEAGVLVNYKFCGSYNGVFVHINPEILSFTDVFAAKLAATENQSVSPTKRKVFPDISKESSTQTLKNDFKKKDDALQSSCDKESAEPTASFDYTNVTYKNTLCKQEKNSPGGAAENVKVPKTLSEYLRDQIQDLQQLAVDLAAGVYNNYVPIDIRHIYAEAGSGTLTEEEFRQLRIQDHFKSHAKIYRNASPFAGSWRKAINDWLDNRWVTHNGHPFNKMTIANYTEEFRWCTDDARRWYLKTNIPPLYPGDYFDFTRKTKYEIGFEYQRTRYQRHLKSRATKEANRRKRERDAELRKAQANDAKRFKTELNRFLKGRITLPQLEKYITDNLPPQFMRDLPTVLQKRMNNL